jgi:hypothetical protein
LTAGATFLSQFLFWSAARKLSVAVLRYPGEYMQGAPKEPWQILSQRATEEQDPARLLELVDELDRVLREKEEGLKRQELASVKAA